MEKNKITEITALLDKKIFDIKEYPIGLADGKMGHCIYYYYLCRLLDNNVYKQKAEHLVDEIFEKIKLIKNLDIKNGFAGIGLGIEYLIDNRYVTGDSNDILTDIDNELFKKICNLDKIKEDLPSSYLQLIYYFTVRLKKQNKNSENEHFFKEAVINAINFISEKIYRNFSEEPVSFNLENPSIQSLFVLSQCVEFYKEKTNRILKDISSYTLSKIPIIHANRLNLLYAMDNINKKIKIKGWDEHIKLLVREINVEKIIENELADDIYFSNGLSAIYMLLSGLGGYFSPNQICKHKRLIINKIESSPLWDRLIEDDFYLKQNSGLFSGYKGVSLLLHKHYNDENRLN